MDLVIDPSSRKTYDCYIDIIILLMDKNIRLAVTTNTNIRFVAALPPNITIAEAFKHLFQQYRTVVIEHISKNSELLQGK